MIVIRYLLTFLSIVYPIVNQLIYFVCIYTINIPYFFKYTNVIFITYIQACSVIIFTVTAVQLSTKPV